MRPHRSEYRASASQRIARQVQAFIEQGGAIQEVPYGVCTDGPESMSAKRRRHTRGGRGDDHGC